MIRQALLGELQFEAENTRKLFDAIPDEVLDYKPNEFNWTIGQMAAHTAEIYSWWDSTLNQDVLEMSTYTYDKGDISNMSSIKEKLEENISKAVQSLENYPEEKFKELWTMKKEGIELMPAMPRSRVIRGFLMNHLYHHRGELIAYLRANGKPVPGLYGPSYEEQMTLESV
ncbi:DinB family protein [Aquimarina sp. 2304DJ70-9]|uniref:DinB family protein n=1 Tax=Aquimarina penaris TaxID=3231044 RepID=UPI00346285A8